MTASTTPRATTSRHTSGPQPLRARQGRRHAANVAPALATRSHATPSGSTRAKSSTAKDGPR
jgi:hypothetical protein